jgi:hypothetical protein
MKNLSFRQLAISNWQDRIIWMTPASYQKPGADNYLPLVI